LLTALLRVLAELVLHVAPTLQMIRRRPAECHSDVAPTVQPGKKSGIQQSECNSVAASDDHDDDRSIIVKNEATPAASFSGLSRQSRLARHRDRQLYVPLIPTNVGIQGKPQGLFRMKPQSRARRTTVPGFRLSPE